VNIDFTASSLVPNGNPETSNQTEASKGAGDGLGRICLFVFLNFQFTRFTHEPVPHPEKDLGVVKLAGILVTSFGTKKWSALLGKPANSPSTSPSAAAAEAITNATNNHHRIRTTCATPT
jgi:hypothetical protein